MTRHSFPKELFFQYFISSGFRFSFIQATLYTYYAAE
jgi:hypothetical protein